MNLRSRKPFIKYQDLVSGLLKRRLVAQTEQNFGGLELFCEFEREPKIPHNLATSLPEMDALIS